MTLVPARIGDRRVTVPVPRPSDVPGADADIDFLLRGQTQNAPQCVLAVPCGRGDHALALARLGHHVTAIARSPRSIAAAEAIACTERLPLRFAVGDIESLVPGELFDGVICLGGAISRFDAKASALFLNLAAAALRPHGWLALDSDICTESVFPLPTRFRAGVVHGGERAADHRHMATSGELVSMVASAGFRVTGLHADGATFAPGARRLLITATRVY